VVLWDTPGIHSDRSRMLIGARRGDQQKGGSSWTSPYVMVSGKCEKNKVCPAGKWGGGSCADCPAGKTTTYAPGRFSAAAAGG